MAQNKFIEEEISFSGRFSRSVFSTLAKSFAEFKWRVFFLLILGIMGRFLLLFSANTIGYWADSLCRNEFTNCKPVPSFWVGLTSQDFVFILACLACTGFVINTVFRVAISRTGSYAVSTLYDEVTYRTSRLPMSFFDTTPVGRIVTRFSSDYAAIFRMAGGPLGEFLCLLFDLILMFILTAVASVYFLPILILVMILNFFFYQRANKGLRIERRALSRLRGPGISHFAETVQGSTAIKVFGKRRTFIERYDFLMKDFFIQKIQTAIAVNIFSLKMMTITALMLLVTGVGGIWMTRSQGVSVGSLGVAFTFIMMTSTTIQQFFEWLANLEEALTGIERMDHYLHLPLEAGGRMPPHARFNLSDAYAFAPREQRLFEEMRGDDADDRALIQVQHLTLRYRSDLSPVLHNVNFIVNPGEQLAIVGRTGSGKSSLIQAMFCLYPPEEGGISIGGFRPDFEGLKISAEALIERKLLPLSDFRRRMALIPQEPNLFRGSVRQNLVGQETIDDDRLWRTLENIGIAKWVKGLGLGTSRGLKFQLAEGAKNISLGERQLLCMARALLQRAPIMIMDEATSSIDPGSEELLVKATQVHMKTKTRIIVAHRLSTIERADRVLWLEKGRIRMLDRPERVLPEYKRAEE